jgi:protein-tyrosine kinase
MSIVERALNTMRRRSAERGDSVLVPGAAGSRAGRQAPVAHARVDFDPARLREAGALPPPQFERQLAEQFRRIKRPLIEFAQASRASGNEASGNLIMVTSSFPAEGKTFTSINLAASISQEKDASVLLVDADIASPKLSSLLGGQSVRGLFDALADESINVESLIVDTSVKGLSFLAAGTLREASSELLASNRMASLVNQLVMNDPRRLIVLDSPPMLLTTESRELARVAGQIVLVIHAGTTPQESVREAVAMIPDGKHVGTVLNQVDPASADVTLYGYGRYGSYGNSTGNSHAT